MNRTEAYQKDRKGDFYVDDCEKTNGHGVFGSETGFCYGSFSDAKDAHRLCNDLFDGKARIR
jgi:hypothetical protein